MKSNSRNILCHQTNSLNRRGLVILLVMLCILFISVISFSLLKLALSQRKQAKQEHNRLQTQWLAESALNRAVIQKQINPEYSGENWTVLEAELGNSKKGITNIQLSQDKQNAKQFIFSVVVDYPAQETHRIRISKQLKVNF